MEPNSTLCWKTAVIATKHRLPQMVFSITQNFSGSIPHPNNTEKALRKKLHRSITGKLLDERFNLRKLMAVK